jgi:hypothetical protein
MTSSREVGEHSYQINCHQFNSEYRNWQKNKIAQGHALGVMTKGFERIWITREEIEQVAAAIQSKRSLIALG